MHRRIAISMLAAAGALLAACNNTTPPAATNRPAAAPPAATASAAKPGDAGVAPRFEVDPLWPKPLPNHWLLGSTIGVAADSRDHVWIIHRRQALNAETEASAGRNAPKGECCTEAPPVLEFDPAGNLVSSWGGPGQGYDWPKSNHGITVDHMDNVWIGGNDPGDAHLLKFTRTGQLLLQLGKPGQNKGSNDPVNFWRVAKISIDPSANEAYISDGYGNRRVVVIDVNTGERKRYWGAYGNKPDDTDLGPYDPSAPPAQQFRNPVHCAEPSNDGLLYVCDRVNDRIQVFRKDGTFVSELRRGAGDARRGLGVGHRVLEGPGPGLHLPRRRFERARVRHPPRVDEDPDELRRRRPPARPVLRRAQHRDGLARATSTRPRLTKVSGCRSSSIAASHQFLASRRA